jgi:hypothetical protein
MDNENYIQDQLKEPINKRSDWRKLFKYQWIAKNTSYFLFLAVLAIIYIANGHWADKTIRNINANAQALKNMQYEYKGLKSELMFQSKESELSKAVQPLGLKPLMQPAIKIISK